jgi:hypothetical protein
MSAVTRPSEFKHVLRRLEGARQGLKELQGEWAAVDEQIRHKTAQVRRLEAEAERLKAQSGGLMVSEHALLRYVERVLGFDLDDLRRQVLPDEVAGRIKVPGSGTFPAGTHKVVVKDGVIITVVGGEEEG